MCRCSKAGPRGLCLAGLGVMFLVSAAVAGPVSTAITYQGQLLDAGAPADGPYDFIFRLFDDPLAGVQIGSDVVLDDVSVSGGLFTVQLDFGAGAYTGDARWLEVQVRPGGSTGAYTTLSPRQELTAAPFALYALAGAGSFWQANGSDIYNANSGNVGIGTSSPVYPLQVVGDSYANAIMAHGTVAIGKGQNEAGVGLSVSRTISLQPFLFSRLDIDGSALDAYGAAGGITLELNSTSDGNVTLARGGGRVGVGVVAPQARLHVSTGSLNIDGNALYGTDALLEAPDAVLDLFSNDGGSWGSTLVMAEVDAGGALTNEWAIARTTTAAGANLRFTFGTNANYAANSTMLTLDDDGDVGIGTTNPTSRLHILSFDNSSLMNAGQLGTGAGVNISMLNASNPNPALSVTGLGTGPALDVTGTARVDVLEITGADLAERFPARETLEPGTVVEIDPEHPGELRMARGAYNRRVAGVVSGANGLNAGTILGHRPGSEDGPPIALSGRVWVRCDASQHAIEIGDLLTTSDTPGHAMKVIDHARAQGAILGKAMTPLARGERGLVLVLVSLQ